MYQSSIKLRFHTTDTEMLYTGGTKRPKEFIPSFNYTRKRVNKLYAMALKKNPYAEAALIELDFRLSEIEDLVGNCKTVSRNCIRRAKNKGIHIKLLERKPPYTHKLSYTTEYTVLMARMLTQTDEAFRYIRTAHISNELKHSTAVNLIKQLRRNVRGIYESMNAYAKRIQPGITRNDIHNRTAHAQSMIDKFGVPNKAILNGDLTYKVQRIAELALD